MFFWNRVKIKQIPDELLEEFKLLQLKQDRLEALLDNQQQQFKVLRGFVNRKVGIEPDKPDTEPEDDEEEDTDDGFDHLRQVRRNINHNG